MKIAYLVLTHQNPKLLQMRINALSSEDSSFFVHVDRKAPIQDFSHIMGNNLSFTRDRVPVYWAEFSGVEATLNLMRQVLESPQHYDYLVYLSASDYPIRSRQYIHNFFQRNRGNEFISLLMMPNAAAGKRLSFITKYRVSVTKPVRHFVSRALGKVGLGHRDYRKYLGDLEPYAGNTWWALTSEACAYILDFVSRHPKVVNYFRNVAAPDELLFHTIIGNSAFAPNVRRNLMFEDWSRRGNHPELINQEHLRIFESQNPVLLNDFYGTGEALFARKFCDSTLHLATKIDEMIVAQR